MRSTDEWIGKTDDDPIPARVRLGFLLASEVSVTSQAVDSAERPVGR
jgi:hypothetical protein